MREEGSGGGKLELLSLFGPLSTNSKKPRARYDEDRRFVILPFVTFVLPPVRNPTLSYFSCKLWFSASSKEWIIYRQSNNFSKFNSVQM